MPADVLFLCPHHAAKSVIAAATFNRLAQQSGLHLTVDSAGTEPSEAVMPVVVTLLRNEGIDVSQHQPRRVTVEELETAGRIISMGCSAEELGLGATRRADRIEHWNDVPPVSQDPDGARDAIRTHVKRLIVELIDKGVFQMS